MQIVGGVIWGMFFGAIAVYLVVSAKRSTRPVPDVVFVWLAVGLAVVGIVEAVFLSAAAGLAFAAVGVFSALVVRWVHRKWNIGRPQPRRRV
jgi:hypothetical protein